MKELLQNLINLLLPPRCLICGKTLGKNNGLCAQCFNKIKFISTPYCECCGRPFVSEAGLSFNKKALCGQCLHRSDKYIKMQRSAFIYDDFAKKLILDFKFYDKTVSAETLANMLFTAGRDIWQQKPDLLIPVPLHRLRLLTRRYNQSALLVKFLALKTGIAADYFSLRRKRNTIPQVKLSGASRRKNLRYAFNVHNSEAIKNKKVVLIDDVSTTGSTLRECAKTLQKAGAKEVFAVTLARTED